MSDVSAVFCPDCDEDFVFAYDGGEDEIVAMCDCDGVVDPTTIEDAFCKTASTRGYQ
jgi:hypothetical protein